MFIPTPEQLDEAVNVVASNSDDDQKLLDAMKDSAGVLSLWVSILETNFAQPEANTQGLSHEEMVELAKSDLKTVMTDELKATRNAVKDGLFAGLQVGLALKPEQDDAPVEINQKTLGLAAMSFGLETVSDEGREEFLRVYNDLVGDIFVHLLTLAYAVAQETELSPKETHDMLLKDVPLAKRMGMALAIGISLGTRMARLKSNPVDAIKGLLDGLLATAKGTRKKTDQPIRGGWK